MPGHSHNEGEPIVKQGRWLTRVAAAGAATIEVHPKRRIWHGGFGITGIQGGDSAEGADLDGQAQCCRSEGCAESQQRNTPPHDGRQKIPSHDTPG
jgi:hypothetical protein